jgi:hypothetical protein
MCTRLRTMLVRRLKPLNPAPEPLNAGTTLQPTAWHVSIADQVTRARSSWSVYCYIATATLCQASPCALMYEANATGHGHGDRLLLQD